MATTQATGVSGLTPGATASYAVKDDSRNVIVGGLSGVADSDGNLTVPSIALPSGSPGDVWLMGSDTSGIVIFETLQIAVSSNVALLAVDSQGRVTTANPAVVFNNVTFTGD